MFKKILIIIILLINLLSVNARTKINEGVWYEEKLDDSKYLVVDTLKKYKWYKEEIIYSEEYYLRGFNPLSFDILKEDDYLETEWSAWSDEVPLKHEDRLIELKMVKKYRELKPIRYIYLDSFQGGIANFNITEMNILIEDEPFSYEIIECNGCSTDLINQSGYVLKDGSIKIDLGDYYPLHKIKIELYMYDINQGKKSFNLYFLIDNDIHEEKYIYYEFNSFVV